jgi:serine/threonine protein kinase
VSFLGSVVVLSGSKVDLRMSEVTAQVYSILHQTSTSAIAQELWSTPFERVNLSLFGASSHYSRWKVKLTLLHDMPITRVYDVRLPRHMPPAVLVYKQHCQDADHPVNMMGYDFWFLRHLSDSGLVPRVYDLSGPLPASRIQRAGKLISFECPAGVDVEIRYIIMEKITGRSIDELTSSYPELVPIPVAVRYAIRMIRAVEILHNRNVIHGDPHSGNFLIDSATDEIKVIDFERSRIFHPNDYHESQLSTTARGEISGGAWESPWEAIGWPVSFRDDIHRILVSLAVMVYGDAYFDHFDAWAITDPHTWLDYRSNGHIFHVPGRFQPLFSLTSRIADHKLRDEVKTGFGRIQELTMSMDVLHRPDYDGIVDLLDDIIFLLTQDA